MSQTMVDYNNYAIMDLHKFAGQWVIIFNGKVAKHGKHVKKIMNEFKKEYPHEVPLIVKIPVKDILLW